MWRRGEKRKSADGRVGGVDTFERERGDGDDGPGGVLVLVLEQREINDAFEVKLDEDKIWWEHTQTQTQSVGE